MLLHSTVHTNQLHLHVIVIDTIPYICTSFLHHLNTIIGHVYTEPVNPNNLQILTAQVSHDLYLSITIFIFFFIVSVNQCNDLLHLSIKV